VSARTEKQLAYERRRRQERTRKQRRAAKLLGQGMTQEPTASEVGVTSRTLRNWKAAPRLPPRARAPAQTPRPPANLSALEQRQGARPPKHSRHAPRPRRSAGASSPARAQPEPSRPPAPPSQQETTTEAGEQPPSGFRKVDGVPALGRRRRLAAHTPRTRRARRLLHRPPRPIPGRPLRLQHRRRLRRPDRDQRARRPPRANTNPRDRTRQTQRRPRPVNNEPGQIQRQRKGRRQRRRGPASCSRLCQPEVTGSIPVRSTKEGAAYRTFCSLSGEHTDAAASVSASAASRRDLLDAITPHPCSPALVRLVS
jgi:hypothetical protein